MAQLVIPNTVTAGTEITAAPLQNNFNAISSWANGGIGASNIESSAITSTKVANAAVTSTKLADRAVTMAKMETKIASGSQWFTAGPLDTYSLPSVTFPVGLFSQPPIVVVGWGGWSESVGSWSEQRSIAVEPGSITKDGCKVVTRSDGITAKSKTFSWIAVGV